MATPGTFTCSVMADITIKQEEMFTSGIKKELVPKTNVLRGLAERQQVVVNDVMRGKKCVGVEIYTLRSCDTIVGSCDAAGFEIDCVIAGTETGTECKTFTNNLCEVAKFSVSEEDCDNHASWEDAFAYREMYALVKLDEAIAKKVGPYLQTAADVNPWTSGLASVPAGQVNNELEVAAANWDSSLLGEFHYAATLAEMNDYTILSDRNLWTPHFLAKYEGAACCTTDALFGDSVLGNPIIFDAFNLDTITSTQSTYLVDSSALVFWGKNQYENDTPLKRGKDNFIYYRKKSPSLVYRSGNQVLPVYYDVIGQETCSDNAGTFGRHFVWNFNIEFRGGLVSNLADCNSRIGVLEYQNDCTVC